jgi:hypothetical protein
MGGEPQLPITYGRGSDGLLLAEPGLSQLAGGLTYSSRDRKENLALTAFVLEPYS